MGKKLTLTFDVPEDLSSMVVKQSCAVISGWDERDGAPVIQVLYGDDTAAWTARGLFEAGLEMCHLRFQRMIGK